MSRPGSWILIAVVLVVAGSVSWTLHRRTVDVEPLRDANATHEASLNADAGPSTDEAGAASLATNARSTTPLPPADAPVAEVYESLRARADAGDARAGCRLGFELSRCQAYARNAESIASGLRKHERELVENTMADFRDGANELAEEQARVLELAANCRALPDGAVALADDTLFRAANAGNVEAQLRYIDGQGLGLVGRYTVGDLDSSYLRHPGFDRWRREAPRMARDLLARGNPAALSLYIGALGRDETPFEGLVPDDPVASFAYLQVLRDGMGLARMSQERFSATEQARIATTMRELFPAFRGVDVLPVEPGDPLSHPATVLEEGVTARCE